MRRSEPLRSLSARLPAAIATLSVLGACGLAACGNASPTGVLLHFVIGVPVYRRAASFAVDVYAVDHPFPDQPARPSGDATVSASGGRIHVTVPQTAGTPTAFDETVQFPLSAALPVNFEAWAYDASGREIAKLAPPGTTVAPGTTPRVAVELLDCELACCAPYVDAGPPDAAAADAGAKDGAAHE